jgi:hypothetical protein
MPSHCPPLLRRLVVALCAVLLGLSAVLVGSTAAAYPYAGGSGPRLVVPTEVTFLRGQPGQSYVIEADGDPVPAIGVDRLPAGLHLIAHADGSATIAGTPTGPVGPTDVQVRAQSDAGSVVQTLTVTIQQAPSFADPAPIVFAVGEFAGAVIRTVGYPAPSIGLEGDLPLGLTFVDNGDGTATITGTPVDGPLSTPITLTAVNVVADASFTTDVRVVVRRPNLTGSPVVTVRSAGPQREP